MTRLSPLHQAQFQSRRTRHGLSILEVMLAIAILGVALATMGELISIGARGAQGAQETTTATLLCENKMAELVVGITPLASTSGTFEENPEWAYEIEVTQVDQTGLVSAMVAAAPLNSTTNAPSFRLYRLIVDPVLKYPVEEEEDAATTATATATATATGTGS